MKTKKTGKTMRVAGLLLALVLVTSCFVGGTFAKYTTGNYGTDNARVAKFGVTVKGSSDMFDPTYKTDDKSVTAITNSVAALNDKDNLVAPGTKRDNCLTASVEGTPEVAVKVEYVATMTLNGKWEYKYTDEQGEHTDFYCPLIIKVNGTEIKGTNYTDKEEFIKAVTDAVSSHNAQYAPKTNLANETNDKLSISWEWPFEVKDTDGKVDHTFDLKDTYLGDLAANAADGEMPKIDLGLYLTVTQID